MMILELNKISLIINKLIWLENIVEKLLNKHNVKKIEIEEIFLSKPLYRYIEKGHQFDENVYAAFGSTKSNRYLIVFFVYKKGNQGLIISARSMTEKEKKYYVKKKKLNI